MNILRSLMVFSMLATGGTLLFAQQNGNGDIPQASPGQGSPDIQQEHSAKKGSSTEGDTSAAGNSPASGNAGNAASSPTGSGKKPKKNHNVETHGPQRHHPNGQS